MAVLLVIGVVIMGTVIIVVAARILRASYQPEDPRLPDLMQQLDRASRENEASHWNIRQALDDIALGRHRR